MIDIEMLSKDLKCNEEDLDILLQEYVEISQVYLANMEDAIDKNDGEIILKEANKIKKASERVMIVDIIPIIDQIGVSVMKRRVGDYPILHRKLEEMIEQIYRVECCYV